jgi:hypothetical protein
LIPTVTVPDGVLGELAVSVTVAVHVDDCPTATALGEQLTPVLVGSWIVIDWVAVERFPYMSTRVNVTV